MSESTTMENQKPVVSYRSSISAFVNTVQKIKFTERQLNDIEKMPFHILIKAAIEKKLTSSRGSKCNIELQPYFSVYDKNTGCFKIKGRLLPFESVHLKEIFGIEDGENEIVLAKKYVRDECDFAKRRFGRDDDHRLKRKRIEEELLIAAKGDSDIDRADFIRLITLMALNIIFVPLNTMDIFGQYASLVEDIDQLKSLGWSKHIHEFLVESIIERVADRKTRYIEGCITGFAYWMCEFGDYIKPDQGDNNTYPKCLKWDFKALGQALRSMKDTPAVVDTKAIYRKTTNKGKLEVVNLDGKGAGREGMGKINEEIGKHQSKGSSSGLGENEGVVAENSKEIEKRKTNESEDQDTTENIGEDSGDDFEIKLPIGQWKKTEKSRMKNPSHSLHLVDNDINEKPENQNTSLPDTVEDSEAVNNNVVHIDNRTEGHTNADNAMDSLGVDLDLGWGKIAEMCPSTQQLNAMKENNTVFMIDTTDSPTIEGMLNEEYPAISLEDAVKDTREIEMVKSAPEMESKKMDSSKIINLLQETIKMQAAEITMLKNSMLEREQTEGKINSELEDLRNRVAELEVENEMLTKDKSLHTTARDRDEEVPDSVLSALAESVELKADLAKSEKMLVERDEEVKRLNLRSDELEEGIKKIGADSMLLKYQLRQRDQKILTIQTMMENQKGQLHENFEVISSLRDRVEELERSCNLQLESTKIQTRRSKKAKSTTPSSMVKAIKTRSRKEKNDEIYEYDMKDGDVIISPIQRKIGKKKKGNNLNVTMFMTKEDKDLLNHTCKTRTRCEFIYDYEKYGFMLNIQNILNIVNSESIDQEIVNGYCWKIQQDQQPYETAVAKYTKSCKIFDAGLWTCVLDPENYKERLEKLLDEPLMLMETEHIQYYVFPICTTGIDVTLNPSHWCLLVLDREYQWSFYNTMKPPRGVDDNYFNSAKLLIEYVTSRMHEIWSMERSDAANGPPNVTLDVANKVHYVEDCPRQEPGSQACAVLICSIIEDYCKQQPIKKRMTKLQVYKYRAKMISTLLRLGEQTETEQDPKA